MRKRKYDKYTRKIDRKMRSYGEIDYDKKVIRVNPSYKRGELLNTIIHEELHRKHPDWNEKKVKKESTKREKSLTIADAVKILKKYQRKRRKK
jgi:hypothetical protein